MKKRVDLGMAGVILALAWPTMLEQLMQTAVQYIDTAMVGTLGTQATAAVGATSTVNWLFGSSEKTDEWLAKFKERENGDL